MSAGAIVLIAIAALLFVVGLFLGGQYFQGRQNNAATNHMPSPQQQQQRQPAATNYGNANAFHNPVFSSKASKRASAIPSSSELAAASSRMVALTPNTMAVELTPNIMYVSVDTPIQVQLHPNILYKSAGGGGAPVYDQAASDNGGNSTNIVYAVPMDDSTGTLQSSSNRGQGNGARLPALRRVDRTHRTTSSSGSGGGANNVYDMQAPRWRGAATNANTDAATAAGPAQNNHYDTQVPRGQQARSERPGATTSWAGYEMVTTTGYQAIEIADGGGGGGGGGGGATNTGPPRLISRQEIKDLKEAELNKGRKPTPQQQVARPGRGGGRYVNPPDDDSSV